MKCEIYNKDLTNTHEIWRAIPKYEGRYEISSMGRVRSVDREVVQFGHKKNYTRIMLGKEIKQKLQNGGYSIVRLCKNGVCRAMSVHRLVLETFLPNADKTLQANHINGDKTDNRLSNLEWVTQSENIKHSYSCLKRKSICVPVKCVETGIIYDSMKNAASDVGVSRCAIEAAVSGRNKTAGGYRWVKA